MSEEQTPYSHGGEIKGTGGVKPILSSEEKRKSKQVYLACGEQWNSEPTYGYSKA